MKPKKHVVQAVGLIFLLLVTAMASPIGKLGPEISKVFRAVKERDFGQCGEYSLQEPSVDQSPIAQSLHIQALKCTAGKKTFRVVCRRTRGQLYRPVGQTVPLPFESMQKKAVADETLVTPVKNLLFAVCNERQNQ